MRETMMIRIRHLLSPPTTTRVPRSNAALWRPPSSLSHRSLNSSTAANTVAASTRIRVSFSSSSSLGTPPPPPPHVRRHDDRNFNNSSKKSLAIAALVASLPFFVWVNDSLVGLVRVDGRSMEPTLREGDIVLVRKANAGVVLLSLQQAIFSKSEQEELAEENLRRVLYNDHWNNTTIIGSNPHAGGTDGRVFNIMAGRGLFYDGPVFVVPGQVVVFKSPESAFPNVWHVKRCAGVGGQWIRTVMQRRRPEEEESSSLSRYVLAPTRDEDTGTGGGGGGEQEEEDDGQKVLTDRHPPDDEYAQWKKRFKKNLSRRRRRRHGENHQPGWRHGSSPQLRQRREQLQVLPPYTMYMLGDNFAKSHDGRHYGPVSKNLAVGVAECIVWPPNRWQRISQAPPRQSLKKAGVHAFWR